MTATPSGVYMCGCGQAHPLGSACPEDQLRAALEHVQELALQVGSTGVPHEHWIRLAEVGTLGDDEYQALQHVLFHFGAGGYPGGQFTQALLHALAVADIVNRQKLAGSFPTLVGFFDVCRNVGVERLAAAARP